MHIVRCEQKLSSNILDQFFCTRKGSCKFLAESVAHGGASTTKCRERVAHALVEGCASTRATVGVLQSDGKTGVFRRQRPMRSAAV